MAVTQVEAQRQATHELAINYVLEHKEVAVDEMHRTGIPASIKLAQGILESNFGRSRLAVLANNHFGAKCHNTWKGMSISHDDDAPGECFRKYYNVQESYLNHSAVLSKKRYRSLFYLSLYDYQAWAHGLKKAGYATDPYYAYKLIAIIERYSLFVYDRVEHVPVYDEYQDATPEYKFVFTSLDSKEPPSALEGKNLPLNPLPHLTNVKEGIKPISVKSIMKFNGAKTLEYTVDVWPVQVSEAYSVGLDDLLALNDMGKNTPIPAYTPIYLSKRKSKANRKYKTHKVVEGECMHDIAIAYGMDLEALHHLNQIEEGTEPKVGVKLNLRKKVETRPDVYGSEEMWAAKSAEKKPLVRTLVEEVQENLEQANKGVTMPKPTELLSINTEEDWTSGMKSEKKKPKTINTENEKVEKTARKVVKPAYVFHTVKEGETLYRLSVNYKVSVEQLKKLNRLQSNTIYAGNKLRIF